MFKLSPIAQMTQEMTRAWCRKNLMPAIPAMEHGELLPFDLMRNFMKSTGMDALVRANAMKRIKELQGVESGEVPPFKAKLDEGEGGGDPMMGLVVVKELARCSPGFAMGWGVMMGLSGAALLSKGTAAQIEKYGIPAITLEKISSWCLTEPGAGSDAFGSMRTTAKPDGDHYVLNGSKMFITNGPYADIFVVYAKLDRGQPREQMPVNAFILERGMPGFHISKPLMKMGMRDSPTAELAFDNVRVHRDNLLGGKEKSAEGRADTKEGLSNERTGIPAMAWGIIEECYERTLKYAQQRQQFGKPIGEFQAVQLKIAEMYIALKNVESIVYRTAWMQQAGERDTAFTNASKAYCSEMATKAAALAIQIHGGYGYMEEYHIEKLSRDAKLLELGAGTTDINLLSVARLQLGLA